MPRARERIVDENGAAGRVLAVFPEGVARSGMDGSNPMRRALPTLT